MGQKNETQDQLAKTEQAALKSPPAGEKKRRSFPKFMQSILLWLSKNKFLSLCILCILLLIASASFCFFIGPAVGRTAGTAVGSWRGVTQGIQEGAQEGKDAGLSAEDTEARIGNKMVNSGNLQVLLVDLRLTDLYLQGPEQNPYYAALFGIKGTGIFSVDLTQAQPTYSEQGKITIVVPAPVFTPYLDDSSIEVFAEYERPFFNGSTADGYRGYLNSREQVDQTAQEEMLSLMEAAKTSAQKQIELLAKSVCGDSASIEVDFLEEER